jgi:hypothetical protein
MNTCLIYGNKKMRHLPVMALLLCAAFAAVGCITEAEEEVAPSTDTGSSDVSNPPVGVVDDSAGFYVRARQSSDYTYYTHRATQSGTTPATYAGSFDWTRECVAELGDDITCFVEGAEFDLWHFGYTLQYNVPSNMCTYVGVRMPFYYKYPAGRGAPLVEYTQDEVTAAITDEINSEAGVPYCPFDHTRIDGPNCCIGKYILTVNKTNGTSPPSPPTVVDWGGELSACLGGPAIKLQTAGGDGFPATSFFFVAGTGINQADEIKTEGARSASLFQIANYFDIATTRNYGFEHSVINPLGIRPVDLPPAFSPAANQFLAAAGTPIPIPLSSPAIDATNHEAAGTTFPFFEYACLNQYKEIRARIRVMVRPWDSIDQLGSATAYTPNYLVEGGVGGTDPMHDLLTWNEIFFNYTDNSGDSVRQSWRNTGAIGDCVTTNDLAQSYTATTLPCRTSYTDYLSGFPGEFN